MNVRRHAGALVLALALVAAACGDDGGSDTAPTAAATTTDTASEVLEILVTNDDGVGAAGIDALVEGLRTLGGVDVVVSAPAENQSGAADRTTDGLLTTSETTTASGYPAVAVDGFPADAVTSGLDEVADDPPDLVVSGSNQGQNVGPLTEVSGTVGAALTAARRGIPALAVSQGLADPIDYEPGVQPVLDWIEAHRDALLAGDLPADVVNINAPTCTEGTPRGVVEVPVAADAAGRDLFAVDCTSTLASPVDDIDALVNGFVSLSVIDVAA